MSLVPESGGTTDPNRGIQVLIGLPLSRTPDASPEDGWGNIGICRLTPPVSLLMSPLFFRHAGCYEDGQRTGEMERGMEV